MIAEQQATGTAAGDHFAKPGANDRVWNALGEAGDPRARGFVDYYAQRHARAGVERLARPGYQMTSQVNVVNPGGEAQTVHRDYHLGFQSDEQAEQYPAHVHRLSPVLTLQGAVAHTDMPVETGPTQYLPHSQKYELGLSGLAPARVRVSTSRPTSCSCRWRKGDAAFFNPALFHAPGEPLGRHPADGQPAAGLVRLRPGDGVVSTGSRISTPSSRPAPSGVRRRLRSSRTPLRRRARGLLVPRPTSTATSRWAASHRRPRPSCWPGRSRDVGSHTLRKELAAYAERRRTDEI